MNGQRLIKEMRPLIWPWFGVVVLALLNGFGVSSAGFWLGLPLIAAISFGSEFENRTVPLMLSQPIDRMTVWREKWIVMTLAVTTAAIAYGFGGGGIFQEGPEEATFAGIWIALIIGTTTFWTLVAQSTIGSLILTILQGVGITGLWRVVEWALTPDASVPAIRHLVSAAVAALAYALVMLWLGRRKLARFQAAGVSGVDDLLIRTSAVRHDSAVRLWRSRPSGLLFNLIRKELRLIWPAWLLMIVSIAIVLCLGAFDLIFGFSLERTGTFSVYLIGGLNGLLATVLAGSLSVGEERSLGTHSWQMTLPLPAWRQWFVKLTVVILVSFAGLTVPALLAESIFKESFSKVFVIGSGGNQLIWFFTVTSALSIAAFWCACGVNGTVRAALWSILAIAAVAFSVRMALMLLLSFGQTSVMRFVAVRLGPSIGFALVNRFDVGWARYVEPFLLNVLPLVFALVQSARAFRRDVRNNLSSTLRYVLKPAAVTFIASVLLFAPFVFQMNVVERGMDVAAQVHQNIKQLRLDLTNTDAEHTRTLTENEVVTVVSSDAPRQWFAGATFEVHTELTNIYTAKGAGTRTGMVTTIHLANGKTCKVHDWFNSRTGDLSSRPYMRCM